MVSLTVNGTSYDLDVDPATPLLWVLRDTLGKKGTKFGCGEGQCGTCTVHIDGKATRSCITLTGEAEGRQITTIESLASNALHAIQIAWLKENVPQCGYCQPGQIMTAAALLAANPHPSDDEIREGMSGNLYRCGIYPRILKAIRRTAQDGGG
jgi:isoquinoline 1-oxidoreductase alpha subunit